MKKELVIHFPKNFGEFVDAYRAKILDTPEKVKEYEEWKKENLRKSKENNG